MRKCGKRGCFFKGRGILSNEDNFLAKIPVLRSNLEVEITLKFIKSEFGLRNHWANLKYLPFLFFFY